MLIGVEPDQKNIIDLQGLDKRIQTCVDKKYRNGKEKSPEMLYKKSSTGIEIRAGHGFETNRLYRGEPVDSEIDIREA